jgi:hypothetical protein
MAAPSQRHRQPERTVIQTIEGVAMFALLGLAIASLFLGPVLLPLAIVFGLLALALDQLQRHQEGKRIVQAAHEMGASGPIDYWGKVTFVSGRCPVGETLRRGDAFVIAGDQISLALCPHARQAILDEMAKCSAA